MLKIDSKFLVRDKYKPYILTVFFDIPHDIWINNNIKNIYVFFFHIRQFSSKKKKEKQFSEFK